MHSVLTNVYVAMVQETSPPMPSNSFQVHQFYPPARSVVVHTLLVSPCHLEMRPASHECGSTAKHIPPPSLNFYQHKRHDVPKLGQNYLPLLLITKWVSCSAVPSWPPCVLVCLHGQKTAANQFAVVDRYVPYV